MPMIFSLAATQMKIAPAEAITAATVKAMKPGTVIVDVAYGGMFYVIADAQPLGLTLAPDEGREIVRIAEMIKAAAAEQLPVVHPEQPSFAGITIGQVSGPAHDPLRL